jgi:glycosyltransferase involved in cell wall biosynthesis
VMLLENNPYPQDVRVRSEAQSLVAAGHSVLVLAPRRVGQPARECVEGVAVHRFRCVDGTGHGLRGLLVEYLVAFWALHRGALAALARGATVVHIHNPPDAFFLAGAAFRLAGRQVVFDHHDLGPELVKVKFRRRPLVTASRAAERLTFAAATHVLAANESHAEVARTRGGKRTEQVTVVRNGPPAEWTRLPVKVRPGRLSPVQLVFLGTVSEQDGVDLLAEILGRLRDRTPPVAARLTIIGDGGGRAELERALSRWGVADQVTITGWVESSQVPELIQEADVCLDPAPGTELNQRSTMIKLAEYLALGKPVVAFDLLESRRTVQDAAILVADGDLAGFTEQIAGLAENPELRDDLARRARARAGELTWARSERALLEAYATASAAGEEGPS